MSKDVLELLQKAEGVLNGHFCLTSGLHSNIYFQCAKLYQYPEITEELGKRLDIRVRESGVNRKEYNLRNSIV